MPNIKLPDGNTLAFDKKVTGLKIAEKISKSLSKNKQLLHLKYFLLNLQVEKNDQVLLIEAFQELLIKKIEPIPIF